MELKYPQKQNGMYILSKDQMDDIARMFLQEYLPSALARPVAVDIDWLAEECLYLDVQSKALTHDNSILGIMVFEDIDDLPCLDESLRPSEISAPAGTVLLSSLLSGHSNLSRRRFTLAHETAHWIIHRPFHSPENRQYLCRTQDALPYIACRSSSIENRRPALETDYDWEEWQADSLAAAILMPKRTFTDAADNFLRESGLAQIAEKQPSLKSAQPSLKSSLLISELSGIFKASKAATEIRLKQLGYTC